VSKDVKVETGAPTEMPEFKPTMHMSGEHAPEGVNAGDHVQFQGHGKVTSVSEHQSDKGKPERSVTVEVHHIKHKKGKHPTGRAGGKHADMQDGGKAAMDQALTTDADNDGE
jgi:hypothetical protein